MNKRAETSGKKRLLLVADAIQRPQEGVWTAQLFSLRPSSFFSLYFTADNRMPDEYFPPSSFVKIIKIKHGPVFLLHSLLFDVVQLRCRLSSTLGRLPARLCEESTNK